MRTHKYFAEKLKKYYLGHIGPGNIFLVFSAKFEKVQGQSFEKVQGQSFEKVQGGILHRNFGSLSHGN